MLGVVNFICQYASKTKICFLSCMYGTCVHAVNMHVSTIYVHVHVQYMYSCCINTRKYISSCCIHTCKYMYSTCGVVMATHVTSAHVHCMCVCVCVCVCV